MNHRRLPGLGIASVAAATLLFSLPITAKASEEGKKIFEEKCISCHAMAPTQKMPVKEYRQVKGAPLWFSGSKFKKEWLAGWLAKPVPLLGVTWGTVEKGTNEHIALPEAEAAQVTEYLMSAVDVKMESGKAVVMPKKRSQKRKFLTNSRQLFEKHQGCYACHRYLNKRNLELGGFSAPSLVTAKDRLNGDWVYSFLQNPQKYYPNTKCPIPGKKAVNSFTDKDRANLAGYVVNIGVK